MRKEHLILAVLIIALMLVGLCALVVRITYWFEFVEPEPMAYGKKLALQHQLRIAKVLENQMQHDSWKITIDEQRRLQAIELLSNGRFDEPAVFLYAAVAHHPVWGHMARIMFVDERVNVSQVAYRFATQDAGMPKEQLKFLPGEQIYGQQKGSGYVSSEVVLRASNNVAQGTISDANAYEPEYLLLPKAAYQSLIEGLGEMLLVDKNGNVLDSISITITDFKYRGPDSNTAASAG
jgi:hypothetical protein